MRDGLERTAFDVIAEHTLAHRRTIKLAVSIKHACTEVLNNRSQSFRPRRDDFPCRDVGIVDVHA
jgi:hypothetical protein